VTVPLANGYEIGDARVCVPPYPPTDALDTSNCQCEEEDEDEEEEVAVRTRSNSFVSRLPTSGQFPGFTHTDGWRSSRSC
jgi:hypothetical protein